MINIYSPEFDKPRNWVWSALEKGLSWEEIKMLRQPDMASLEQELQRKKDLDFWNEELTVESWFQIVESIRETEERRQELKYRSDSAMLTDKSEDNAVKVPEDRYSSWVLYKQYLAASGWRKESIDKMEFSTISILKRLSTDTTGKEPIKGLVMGHVQSGKTANMAALMAMAADWGWNMFIVLSGTIENLRKQTQDRLFNDLHRDGNIRWRGLEHLSLKSPLGQRAQDLNFSDDNNERFFTVCLKHSKRLEDLIKWLQADPNKYAQMKIIVIDDEADQGGINTANISKDERSRINHLIVNLVEGRRYDGQPAICKPKAMNYIAYTATPYANFLNEASRESLYPRNFIRTLDPSAEYFGAKEIFGIEGTEDCDGLDILREIEENDLKKISELHKGNLEELPDTLLESVAWFLCAASAMRYIGHKKPISMLVHTSHKQQHHENVARAVASIFDKNNRSRLLRLCRELWIKETRRFSLGVFKRQFPTYPGLDNIRDYPSFEEIGPGIELLVSKISHIQLDKEDQSFNYHEGIHLCIDNCANNGIFDENTYVRLAYPDPYSKDYPSPAPAFIVVGGSTLSRGLTIEGLVSTYFLRPANQADTLMQMGRWFGYRKGYELYPRIWMTAKTIMQFRFLARLEYDLRDDLRRFMEAGADPSEFGPRVRTFPSTIALRLTAPNKMQNAVTAEMDFSGINNQTVVFSPDKKVLDHNIEVAESFLKQLGPGQRSVSGDSMVWRNVRFDLIRDYLFKKYEFHPRATVFNQIDAFCEWFEKSEQEAGYTPWNVVVGGTKVDGHGPDDLWHVPGGIVGKIRRSRQGRQTVDQSVNIGVLRAPKDLYEDIEANYYELIPKGYPADNNTVRETREKAGVGKTPLLILYRINKDSKAPENVEGSNRKDLDVPSDIIGMSIWIPGVKSKSLVKTLTVKIDKQIKDIADETGDLLED